MLIRGTSCNYYGQKLSRKSFERSISINEGEAQQEPGILVRVYGYSKREHPLVVEKRARLHAYVSVEEPLTSHVMESDLVADSVKTNVLGTAVATSMTVLQSLDAASVARTFSNGWLTKYGAAVEAHTHTEYDMCIVYDYTSIPYGTLLKRRFRAILARVIY